MLKRFKKTVTGMLAIMMLFQLLPVISFAQTEAIIDLDFDLCEKVGDLEGWSSSAGLGIAEDENGGKALALNLTADVNNYMTTKYLPEKLTTGIYRLTYSFYAGDKLSTMFWIRSTSGKTYPVSYISPIGQLTTERSYTSIASSVIATNQPLEGWYDVSADIDIDNDTISVEITTPTGEVYRKLNTKFETILGVKLGGILGFTFQVWANKDSQSRIDNIKLVEKPLSVSLSSEKLGNNFPTGETPKITVNVASSSDEDEVADIEIYLKGEEGQVIKKETLEKTVAPNATESFDYLPEVNQYGLYSIDVIVIPKKDGERLTEIQDKKTLNFALFVSTKDQPRNDILGFATHIYNYGTMKQTYELLDMMGANHIRDGISWNSLERVRGQYRTIDMTLDSEYKKDGMENILVLGYGNTVVVEQTDINGNPATPSDVRAPKTDAEFEAWRGYVRNIVSQTKDAFSAYEVWNEYDGYFNTDRLGGEYYFKLLKIAYEEVKKQAPDAEVIGLGGTGTNNNADEFVREVFEHGGLNYCDALSYHPYAFDAVFPNTKWREGIENLNAIVKEYGGEDKPIYFTEMGWATYTGKVDPYHMPSTEKFQAEGIVKACVAIKAYNLGDKISYYDFQEDGIDPSQQQHTFGIVRFLESEHGEFTAKPAFLTASAFNKMVTGGSEFYKTIELDGMTTAAHAFRRPDGKSVIVMWTDKPSVDFSFKLGCETVEVYDVYGNLKGNIKGQNGVFDFGLTNGVLYVVGNFSDFEEAQTLISAKDSKIYGVKNDIVTIELNDANGGNYDVKTTFNKEHFTLINENPKMINGKAVIEYRVSDVADGDYEFELSLYDGENCRYTTKHTANIGKPIAVSMTSEQLSANNDKRWQLEVDILNYANSNWLTGTCKIVSPADIAEQCKTVTFRNLEPKMNRKVYINLPEMLKKRTQNIEVEIMLDYGYTERFVEKHDFTSAYYADEKPVIDGIISPKEWSSTLLCSDNPADVEMVSAGIHEYGGAGDLSIPYAKFMYDEEFLYASLVVKDDVFVPGDDAVNLWKYDSVQFTIEDDFFNSDGALSYTFTEIGMALLKGGPKVYRYSSAEARPAGEIDNCEVAIVRQGDEIVYELKIPWDELFREGYVVNPADIYGFAMIANDNDTGDRWGWIKYNDGIGRAKNIELFGRMRLYQ